MCDALESRLIVLMRYICPPNYMGHYGWPEQRKRSGGGQAVAFQGHDERVPQVRRYLL